MNSEVEEPDYDDDGDLNSEELEKIKKHSYKILNSLPLLSNFNF